MHIVQEKSKYFVKNILKGSLREFSSRNDFLLHLYYLYFKENRSMYYRKNYFRETFLSSYKKDRTKLPYDINISGKDLKVNLIQEGLYYKEIKSLREIIIFDEDLRLLDIRNLYDEIIKIGTNTKEPNFYSWKKDTKYVFRKGPVPLTGKKYRHWNCCKNPKRMQELKNLEDKDVFTYTRAKRRVDLGSLDGFYEDFYKDRWSDKSWKTCTKRKHQWKEQ